MARAGKGLVPGRAQVLGRAQGRDTRAVAMAVVVDFAVAAAVAVVLRRPEPGRWIWTARE